MIYGSLVIPLEKAKNPHSKDLHYSWTKRDFQNLFIARNMRLSMTQVNLKLEDYRHLKTRKKSFSRLSTTSRIIEYAPPVPTLFSLVMSRNSGYLFFRESTFSLDSLEDHHMPETPVLKEA